MDAQETDTPSTPEDGVGGPNNSVLPSGETIIYEFGDDGTFTGWHKEPAS